MVLSGYRVNNEITRAYLSAYVAVLIARVLLREI